MNSIVLRLIAVRFAIAAGTLLIVSAIVFTATNLLPGSSGELHVLRLVVEPAFLGA